MGRSISPPFVLASIIVLASVAESQIGTLATRRTRVLEHHDIGGVIKALLEQNGIPARAIHTDGSVENAELLQDPERSALAIMQYDTALAVYLGMSRPVFKVDVPIDNAHGDPLRVDGMRRIAALHEEIVHIVCRRDALPDRSPRIEHGQYGCQLENEPAIETISTQALLVTTEDLPFDVGKITRVLFEGADYLPIEGRAKAMARDLSSIPLHPAATRGPRRFRSRGSGVCCP